MRQGATEVEGPTVRRFFCHGILRNFIGSYVLIRFPNKSFNVLVQLGPDQDPLRGLQWTKQDTANVSFVYRFGVIQRSESVTLTGASVPGDPWDLDLEEYPFESKGPRASTPKSPSLLAKHEKWLA